jgi:pimeloyl-ACP methyl ester carboxylesterase
VAIIERQTIEKRFQLASGEVAAELSGEPDAPLVIGIPGLSANLRSFDEIYGALNPEGHHRLAYDPRGRGLSDKTPPGSYGWPSHVADILEMADQLKASTFDLIGWSMGTWIAMKVCEMAPGRVSRLVLIDAGGVPDETATVPIYAGLDRLSHVWPSYEEFATVAQSLGIYEPWEPFERLFRYEFEEVEGGVRARTTGVGPREDEDFRKTQDAYALWKSVTMPALMIRAKREILPGMGHILTAEDAQRFGREVPGARVVEVDAAHYNSGVHPESVSAIVDFLDGADS